MQRPGIIPPDEAAMPELRCCPNQQIIVNSSPDPANVESDLVGLFPQILHNIWSIIFKPNLR